ncbi:MAG TPA: hypothetical protein VJA16_08410, partial [Thermoanaerobaculia bacterium]
TWNAKVNAQVTASNSLTLFGSNNSKQKQGRNAGPTRTLPSAWDQGQFGGKPTILKAEDTQIFSPNLYATLLYSHVYGGFFLTPIGGFTSTTPDSYFDPAGVWQNSFVGEQIKRPQTQEKADASTFFNTGSLSHELKYGAAYRIAESATNFNWAGSGWISDAQNGFFGNEPPGTNDLWLSRAALPDVKVKYTNAYAQDTLTTGNLTINAGLRYDRQTGDNQSSLVPANSIAPNLLPGVSYAGGPSGFTWTTWAPRAGLTYALGKDRSTLLRASYSRFADQLPAAFASFLNPLGSISYYYSYTTNPGNGNVTPGQVVPGVCPAPCYSGNVNPNDPGQLLQPNAIASNFTAPITNEFLLSAEHALLPEFVVGFNLTYRRATGLEQEDLLVQDSSTFNPFAPSRVSVRSDYVPVTNTVTLANGQSQSVTWYQLRPGISTGKGLFLHNGDYETTFKGASLTFNKRLSNRWMMRGNFSYNDWYYNKAGDRPDPSIQEAGGITDGNYVTQGSAVLQGSGNGSGSKAWVYINSKWSFAVNGLYQIAPDRPWGFNVAGNLTGRQGYPTPLYETVGVNTSTTGGTSQIQFTSSDSNRLDNIVDVDGRLEKEFTFQDFGLTLGVDCFNLFNEAFILQKDARARVAFNNTNGTGYINETLSPRIFRFGARLSFK